MLILFFQKSVDYFEIAQKSMLNEFLYTNIDYWIFQNLIYYIIIDNNIQIQISCVIGKLLDQIEVSQFVIKLSVRVLPKFTIV